MVKIQCLDATAREMKKKVAKMTALIHELEEEEIQRAKEANAKIRQLEAEVIRSEERGVAVDRESTVARRESTASREELATVQPKLDAMRHKLAGVRSLGADIVSEKCFSSFDLFKVE